MTREILAVDDERDVLMVLEDILSQDGFKVLTARSVAEARQILQTNLPNLILLDIMMPEEDGFVLLNSVRNDSRTRTIPVIMLTALGQTETIMKAMEMKATDYIMKPFTTKDLLELIRRYI